MYVNCVEALRGALGTLYGANATAGAANMLPNLSVPNFEALRRAEAGNHGFLRGQAMINVPPSNTFFGWVVASITARGGFDYNTFKDEDMNGRELWSTRLPLAQDPSSRSMLTTNVFTLDPRLWGVSLTKRFQARGVLRIEGRGASGSGSQRPSLYIKHTIYR